MAQQHCSFFYWRGYRSETVLLFKFLGFFMDLIVNVKVTCVPFSCCVSNCPFNCWTAGFSFYYHLFFYICRWTDKPVSVCVPCQCPGSTAQQDWPNNLQHFPFERYPPLASAGFGRLQPLPSHHRKLVQMCTERVQMVHKSKKEEQQWRENKSTNTHRMQTEMYSG